MIIKNILNKIYIHPFFVMCIFIFILLGKFRFILYFMILIIIHELGHIVISLFFKWRIKQIVILPFAGLTKYEININIPLIEEFVVAIAGIAFQLLFYIILNNIVSYKYFSFINYFIIFFNLIPIYPLDGSKILNVFFNIITSYRNSLLLTTIVSYILIIIISGLSFIINKMIVLILFPLLLEVNKLYKEKDNLFNRFILERYLNDYKFIKEKIVDNTYKMKRGYRHIFKISGKYVTEKYYLNEIYKNV